MASGIAVLSTANKHPEAETAAAASFAALLENLRYLSRTDINLVRKAYKFADEAHLGQMRKNGLPYITHPISVAALCAEWKLDAQAIAAALMHDVLEDCGVTKLEIVTQFGATVAELVDGLTKLDKLEFDTREQNQAESFRKMLLAMARDVRVVLIKLSDRTHNMRTMGDMPRDKWKRISSETLEIYAPIAHRLGLNQTYRELQDLSFRHLHPWRYQTLEKAILKARRRRKDLIERVTQDLDSSLKEHGLIANILGREKTLFSIYNKMNGKHLSFSEITDIYGFRVILQDITQCYTALGVLHQLYKPVPGRFKDYIAIPKVNGYQSLHTTLVGPAGINIEVQMRTESMDVVAESGVAAHWLYKADEPGSDNSQRLGAQWLQSLLDIQQETRDAGEFWDHIRVDLFPDSVYVFTPKSKILSLPRGATVVDFAYAIHTDVGQRAVSCSINGQPAALRQELNNGDVVKVVTDEHSTPNPTWLSFVKTGRARSKIRSYLKQMAHTESRSLGERMLAQALRAEGIAQMPSINDNNANLWDAILHFTGNTSTEELYTDIGMGKRIAGMVAKRMAVLLSERGTQPDMLLITQERFAQPQGEHVSQGTLSLDGSEGSSVIYAQCCMPIPGDGIVGYMGRGEGLTVHTDDCGNVRRLLERDRERFLEVEWSDEPTRPFETRLLVTAQNGKGVLARIAAAIAQTETDITGVEMGNDRDHIDLHFTVAVRDRDHLAHILRNLKRTPAVIRAQRHRPRQG